MCLLSISCSYFRTGTAGNGSSCRPNKMGALTVVGRASVFVTERFAVKFYG